MGFKQSRSWVQTIPASKNQKRLLSAKKGQIMGLNQVDHEIMGSNQVDHGFKPRLLPLQQLSRGLVSRKSGAFTLSFKLAMFCKWGFSEANHWFLGCEH